MACGKCPQCETQMEESSVYGKKVCQCPDCGRRAPLKATPGPEGLNYTKSPKEEEKK